MVDVISSAGSVESVSKDTLATPAQARRYSRALKRNSAPFSDYLECLEPVGGEHHDTEEVDELDDEMGELSDSQSTHPSSSRPTTPSHPLISSTLIPNPTQNTQNNEKEYFTLSTKAERILGLQPGTLAHARAALENARDEVRRTATSTSTPSNTSSNISDDDNTITSNGLSNMKSKMTRAKGKVRAASNAVAGAVAGGHGRVMSVQLGIGGPEEEELRERRRKASDGVLFWQREVERLEDVERLVQAQKIGVKRR